MTHFVCPWCAAAFERRSELSAHWVAWPECSANRTVSNPTQAKYLEPGEVEDGAATLELVRLRDEARE